MTEPKISIIVPVYNRQYTIEACLQGILSSKYKNIEVIVVNDGSTDKSLDICQQYANSDDRLVVINQPNAGVSAARNAAIEVSTGDWITFVDSDDTVNSLCYSSLYGGVLSWL